MSVELRQILLRRGTAAQWLADNPTLDSGEPGYVEDTGELIVGDGSTDFNGLSRFVSGPEIGGGSFVGDLPVVPDRLWGVLMPNDLTSLRGDGVFGGTVALNDAASRFGIEGGRVYVEQDTAATVDSMAAMYNASFLTIYRSMLGKLRLRFQLTDTTSIRFFSGASQWTTNTVNADDPSTTNCAGVQFSTSRGDTNFMFVTKDGSTAITTQDSGVAVDTDVHEVEVDFSVSGEVTVSLLDASGNVEATHTFTTNLPGENQGMREWSGLRNLVAAVRSCRFYGAAFVAPGA